MSDLMKLSELKNIPSFKIFLAFAALYIVWGSTYFAIAISVQEIPPLLLAGVRFFTAGILLLAFCLFKKQRLPGIMELPKIIVPGIFILFFGTGSVMWVEQYLESSVTAIIWAFIPMWFIVLDYRRWRVNFRNRFLIMGLLMGIVGVLVLFFDDAKFNFNDGNIVTNIVIAIGGTMFFVTGSLMTKYTVQGTITAPMKAAVQMMAVGVLSFGLALVLDERQHMEAASISLDAILSLLYLIVFGSVLTYLAYLWLLDKVSSAIVGTYTYVNPLVALILGWLFLDETVTIRQMLALAVIIGSIVLINVFKPKK
ncbi:MAG TPA: EamA family transporter [Pricia antarctica]|uniref:EamA family transporter n=2 Tax=root TaxID=1 RepID=A0A831QQS5_9FLAO|nr:EamA family transporter [Pricia antarctica]